MERKNVRWMTKKRWNYVERKGIEACVLRAEKMERKNVSWLREKIRENGYNGSDKRKSIKVREGKESKGKEKKTTGRDARRRKKGKGGTFWVNSKII
jgi:hypothetical protein